MYWKLTIILPLFLMLAGPKDAVLRQIWKREPLRVWHYETLVVSMFLLFIVLVTGNHPLEWVGLSALVLAHGRNSIMFRMSEAQAKMASGSASSSQHFVECYRWSNVYFVCAEVLWAVYFSQHKAWAALSGVAVFVGYSYWRKWYTKRKSHAGAT